MPTLRALVAKRPSGCIEEMTGVPLGAFIPMPTFMSLVTLLTVATTTGEDGSTTAATIEDWEYDGFTGVATIAVMTGALVAGVTGSNVLVTFVDLNELYGPDRPVLALQAPVKLNLRQNETYPGSR